MENKMNKLEYWVWREDFNRRQILPYNVLSNGILEELIECKKQCVDKADFKELVDRKLRYYFWCRAEHEIVMVDWPPHITVEEHYRLDKELREHIEEHNAEPYRLTYSPDVGRKVDIYEQITINYNIFIDYLWENLKWIDTQS